VSFWQKVQRGVSNAASEAEKQATIAKLSLEANGAKGAISKKYEELGILAAKLVKQEEINHASLQTAIEEISGMENRLHELEDRIAEVRSQPAGSRQDSSSQ
jgi:hypothetical protein